MIAPTLLANTVNLKCVAGGFVVMFAADLLLQLAYFGRKEFHRTAAFCAHHVMVTAAIVLVLVTSNAVVKGDLTCQPAFGQQFQRAVYGGKADSRILARDQAMEFVCGKMLPGFQEGAQNGVTLFRMFQAHTLQMLMQNSLRLANHFAGNTGLVVDPIL